jgi:uncharacterized protein (DUF2235 family)
MAKRLVLCFDGTWNDPTSNTNVEIFYKAVPEFAESAGRLGQTSWYRAGVGTELGSRLLGGGVGVGLSQNMLDGYQFLGREYRDGDEIFIVGFSRGAYTARCLAGLVSKCGVLLPPNVDDQNVVLNAYLYGKMRGADAPRLADGFCGAYGRHVPIKFVGVWDTVGALGLPGHLFQPLDEALFGFVDLQLAGGVQRAYHALAIDEHRFDFRPSLWAGCAAGQTMEQRWFGGDHCDVGGGHADDRRLADIPLRWMMSRAIDAGLELTGALPADPNFNYDAPMHDTYASPGWASYAALNPPYLRAISVGTAGQVVDNTVVMRRQSVALNYQPVNAGL